MHKVQDGIIIQLHQFRLHRAANKGPQHQMTVGCAIDKFSAGETDRQNTPLFDGRNDQPKGIHGAGEVTELMSADHDSAGGVFNGLQLSTQSRCGRITEQFSGQPGRQSDDDRIKGLLFARRSDRPAAAGNRADGTHWRSRMKMKPRASSEIRFNRGDQIAQPACGSRKQSITGSASAFLRITTPPLLPTGGFLCQSGLDDTSMRRFHLRKPRERRLQTELFRVGRVNATNQRLDQMIQRFAAKSSPDELRQTFIVCGLATRYEVLTQQPQSTSHRQNGRSQQGPRVLRRHQHETFRHRHRPATRKYQRTSVTGIRRNQLTGESDFFTQLQPGGLIGDEGVRAELHQKTIRLFRANDAPQALRGFEERHVDRFAAGQKPMGRSQTRDTTSDHCDFQARGLCL